MPVNRLANEKSPYLLQHADNPVDWYPWREEAFEVARRENRVIFLSIGYSTCHWCHVMNRESFSDPGVAAFMNAHFVNIKLDREERPDVDRLYMTYVQATTGGGGWPMSVWLTPDLKPIVGGTYFPPRDAHGRAGFLTVLERVLSAWQTNESAIRDKAEGVIEELRSLGMNPEDGENSLPDRQVFPEACGIMRRRFDTVHGGFGSAPKFPRPSELLFLFQEARVVGWDTEQGRQILHMPLFTLEKMMHGGIHDHLGGGFHRYSVDKSWHIPHYEKMLYDQAQLAEAFLLGFLATGRTDFADTARGIFTYVKRDMTSPGGAFYSAEDADSLAEGASRKTEGAFYIWSRAEIDRLLGGDAPLFCAVYGVEAGGNAAPESDPHGELAGMNTLVRRMSDEGAAATFGMSIEDTVRSLERSRRILFDARGLRMRPHRDDKIITAWNGLMIRAFAMGSWILQDDSLLDTATEAADFLREHLYDASTGLLARTWRGTRSEVHGFAEDYACLIRGLLALYGADFDTRHLAWADALQARQDELFHDNKQGGYFSSAEGDPGVLVRIKEHYDGAEPCANTLSALNLLDFAILFSSPSATNRAEDVLRSLAPQIRGMPVAVAMGLMALRSFLQPERHVVIVGPPADPLTRRMVDAARRSSPTDRPFVLIDNDTSREFFSIKASFYRDLRLLNDRPTAFLCQNFACEEPTNDPARIAW